MNRRQLLRLSMAGGVSALLPSEPALPLLRAWTQQGLVSGESAERLGWVLSGRGQVDTATVADLEEVARRYRHTYQALSVRTLLPLALGHVQAVAELLPAAASTKLRGRLVAAAGESLMLAGALSLTDRCDFRAAGSYLNVGLDAARTAGATELEALVLGALAFHAGYTGHLSEAIGWVQSARRVARHAGNPVTGGWLAAVEGELRARAGEERGSLAALDAAGCLLEAAGPEDHERWVGVGAFTAAKLDGYCGVCYLQLRRPGDAVAVLTAALDRLDVSLRKHRCTALADLAGALIQLGDLDAGCAAAVQSLQLAVGLGHAASVDRVRQLRRSIPPRQRARALRDLDQLLLLAARP